MPQQKEPSRLRNLKFEKGDPFADVRIYPTYQRELKPGKSVLIKIGRKIFQIKRMK